MFLFLKYCLSVITQQRDNNKRPNVNFSLYRHLSISPFFSLSGSPAEAAVSAASQVLPDDKPNQGGPFKSLVGNVIITLRSGDPDTCYLRVLQRGSNPAQVSASMATLQTTGTDDVMMMWMMLLLLYKAKQASQPASRCSQPLQPAAALM